MNFFFGFKNKLLESKLTIPKFTNYGQSNKDYNLYSAEPKNNKWNYLKIESDLNDKDFYHVNNQIIENKKIFFLAKKNEEFKFEQNKLVNINKFTDTEPAFRCNLKIYLNNFGFSSYQSEYPYNMVKKKGSILSPISILTDKTAEKNFLIFKNIYEKPINDKFNLYFINIESKKVLLIKELVTNKSNFIELDKNILSPEIYIFSKNYLGIPIFLTIKNNHLSCEHTHPPHEYILSEDKFFKVSELKNKINEIIN